MRSKIIYLTKNLINNTCYVGYHSTENLETDRYLGSGQLIKCAIKKYGRKNFKREILEILGDDVNWEEREIFWINEKHTKYPNGYNLTDGGEGGIRKIFSEASKKLMSKVRIERNIAKGCNNGMYGIKHTKESRENMSKTKKEKKCGVGKSNSHFDSTIYKFYNLKTGEIFEGCKFDLAQREHTGGNCFTPVIKGKRNHHKNWTVLI
jgi:group I intron endonuclease